MNVLIVVAPHGFRDEELRVPRQELEAASYQATIASTHVGECDGMLGMKVMAELTLKEVDTRCYDGVVFVGGQGARVLFDDPEALRIAREMARQHKVTAAICIAPVILARAGVLAGRRATVFDSEVPALIAAHAKLRALGVVVDGPVITANGPDQARRFAAILVQALDHQLAVNISQQHTAQHAHPH